MKNLLLVLTSVIFLFASCAATKSATAEKEALAHTWILTKGARDQMGCNTSKPLSLTFTEKGVNGYSGCNNYFGPYKLSKKQHIKLGPLASTMMACVGQDCGKIEVGFIRKMDQVNKYRLQNNRLLLYMDKELLLSFRMAK